MRVSPRRFVLRTGLALSAMLAIGAYAATLTPVNGGGTGLAGTAHDFTTLGASTAIGLCTFCHTPHKAQSTLLLWNHTLSKNNFSWDVTSTTAGTTYPTIAGGTYKGPTAKCLSCHDGSVAIGDVGWFKQQAWPTGLLDTKMGALDSTLVVGSGGAMAGNHPVAMPYPFGQAANTYNGSTNGGGLVTAEWSSDPTPTTNTSGTFIRLFNDDGSGNISAGAVGGKTGIECSSCHDPHNKSTVDDYFLRGMLTGSSTSDGYLCEQCHQK